MPRQHTSDEIRAALRNADGAPAHVATSADAAPGHAEESDLSGAVATQPARRANLAFASIDVPGLDGAPACDPNDPDSCR